VGNVVAALLQNYFSIRVPKKYENTRWFDKVIAKIKMVQTFAHSNVRRFFFYLIHLWYFYCVLSK